MVGARQETAKSSLSRTNQLIKLTTTEAKMQFHWKGGKNQNNQLQEWKQSPLGRAYGREWGTRAGNCCFS